MKRQELADAAEEYIYDVLETHAPRDDAYAEANGEYIRQAPLTIGASTEAVIAEAKGRFLGVGAAQYQISENEQSFERSTIGTMLVGMSEELVDQVNYATMVDILIGRRLDAIHARREEFWTPVRAELLELQRDLGEMAYAAVCAVVLMRRHIDRLVELGEYTPRGEGDYVAQLAAECAESGAAMRGASGRSSAEIEKHYHGKIRIECDENTAAAISAYLGRPVTFETPEGLDEIVAAHRMDDDGAGD